jgi:hypothetical protein
MCKESETTKKSTSTQTLDVPDWVQGASQTAVTAATDNLAKGATAYEGDRVADFSADQMGAFEKLRSFLSGNPGVGGQTVGMAQQYATAGPQEVGTERIVDQGGKLGAISDYTNPHEDAVVQRALSDVAHQGDVMKNQLKLRAAGTPGAYGDARHGVVESGLNEKTLSTMARTAGELRQRGYDTAMAQRTGDVNRNLTADQSNAGYNEQALSRLFGGAKGMQDLSQADQSQMLQQVQALLGIGGQQEAKEQAGLDANFQEFLRTQGVSAENIKLLTSVLGGVKGSYDTTQTGSGTETSTAPDNSILGMVGSVAGKAATSAPVAAALAAML